MEDKQFETMENYLQGNLSITEKENFEQELAQNPSLRKELDLYKKLIQSIETEAVRQMLEQVHEQNFAANAKALREEKETPIVAFTPSRLRYILAAAASLALLLVAGWWVFTMQPLQPEALYTSYFEPAIGLPTTLGATDSPRFAEGMVSYKLGEYQEALALWQPLLAANTQNDTLNYFAGVALLADGQPKEAIIYLQQVADGSTENYSVAARWYKGLAYLLDGQKREARTVFTSLAASENPYSSKSQEILKKLE